MAYSKGCGARSCPLSASSTTFASQLLEKWRHYRTLEGKCALRAPGWDHGDEHDANRNMQFMLPNQLKTWHESCGARLSRLPNEGTLRMSEGTLRQPGAEADVVEPCVPVMVGADGGGVA